MLSDVSCTLFSDSPAPMHFNGQNVPLQSKLYTQGAASCTFGPYARQVLASVAVLQLLTARLFQPGG